MEMESLMALGALRIVISMIQKLNSFAFRPNGTLHGGARFNTKDRFPQANAHGIAHRAFT